MASPSTQPRTKPAGLSTRRKIVYAAIPALLLVLLVVALEIGLRIVGFEASDDPYINLQRRVSAFTRMDIDGEPHYRVTHAQLYAGRNELVFPISKPSNTIRVFALGGSACAGWPHPPEEDFGDYLEYALEQAFPDHAVEVLNVAGHGFASYRVREVYRDVIECDPDLVVIYSGNNEFMENRTYLGRTRALLQDSYLVRAASAALGKWMNPENSLSGWGMPTEQLVASIVTKIEGVALELRTDPEQFRQVREHYGFAIGDITRDAAGRDVPICLMTVPSNLRDWRPNVSQHGLDGSDAERWQSHFDSGRRAILEGEPATARSELERALELAPEHAESHYFMARALEADGDADAALSAYRRAKDLDLNPFRALTEFNEVLRSLAAEHSGVHLVDLEQIFLAACERTAPGGDLFLDYVHPVKRGNLLIARALFDLILREEFSDATPASREFVTPERAYDEHEDLGIQRDLVTLGVMMHQHEFALQRAEAILEVLGRGRGIVPSVDAKPREEYVRFFERARTILTDYLEADRSRLLGQPHDEDYEAVLQRSYHEFFNADVIRQLEVKNRKQG